jgi:LmbE family N-acetylglucosaminyl deacetylase
MNSPDHDTDHDTVLRAVDDARRILAEYVEPRPRDAPHTVERLLAVLDKKTWCMRSTA